MKVKLILKASVIGFILVFIMLRVLVLLSGLGKYLDIFINKKYEMCLLYARQSFNFNKALILSIHPMIYKG